MDLYLIQCWKVPVQHNHFSSVQLAEFGWGEVCPDSNETVVLFNQATITQLTLFL